MRWSFLVVSCCLGACTTQSSSIRLDVRTDWVPEVEFSHIDVEVVGGQRATHEAVFGDDYVRGIRAASLDADHGRVSLRAVLRAPDGRELAERMVVLQHRGANTVVTLVFTRDCEEVVCPAGDATATECVGGRCVQPECSPETPDACGPSGCTSAAECEPVAVSCVERVCEVGECFVALVPGSCGATEFCDPQDGCSSRPGLEDAGPPDAGPADGGACAPPCLVLHYDFEGSPMGPAVDRSGNGLDALRVGDAAESVEGSIGQGWLFEQHVDDYLGTDLSSVLGREDPYTLAFWARVIQAPDDDCCVQRLVSLEAGADDIVVQSSAVPFLLGDPPVESTAVHVNSFRSPGNGGGVVERRAGDAEWHHYAIVAGLPTPDMAVFYFDGSPRSPRAWDGALRPLHQVRIGGASRIERAGGLAAIDEVRVYRGALSDDEVAALAVTSR